MEDTQIVDLYLAREESAVGVTAEKYGSRLRALSFGIVADHETAEECENDTYLKTWNSIPPTRPISFSAYLCRIVRNLAITRYRYNKQKCEMSLILDELSEVIPDIHTDPVDEIELKDALESVLCALRDLLLLKHDKGAPLIFFTSREDGLEIAAGIPAKRIAAIYDVVKDSLDDLSKNVNAGAVTACLGARIKLI